MIRMTRKSIGYASIGGFILGGFLYVGCRDLYLQNQINQLASQRNQRAEELETIVFEQIYGIVERKKVLNKDGMLTEDDDKLVSLLEDMHQETERKKPAPMKSTEMDRLYLARMKVILETDQQMQTLQENIDKKEEKQWWRNILKMFVNYKGK